MISCNFLFLISCGDSKNLTKIERDKIPQAIIDEQLLVDSFNTQLIDIKGKVNNQAGAAVSGAIISIDSAALTTTTDIDGRFSFSGLTRKNILLEITAAGMRGDYIPIYLQYPVNQLSADIPTIILHQHVPDSVRMLFGGDVALGRRFLDPDETTASNQVPLNHVDALIQSSDPDTGTKNVLREIRPFYQQADWGVEYRKD